MKFNFKLPAMLKQTICAGICAAAFTSNLVGCGYLYPETQDYGYVGDSSTGSRLGAIVERNSNGQVANAETIVLPPNNNSDDESSKLGQQRAEIAAENARLIAELRQRGIDVRDSARGVVVNLPDVLFQSGKASLTSAAREIVFEISQLLQRAPSRRILIEGHTDSIGTIEYNHRLSESRAREVAQALEANGIPNRMISTRALGETTPLATNTTEHGRRQNRRVEVVIENVRG
ncbi:MAG: OmpA family protein [Pseudomonadota bacterium]|jgi:outer membrane protein OmpA-like peptidoglycan-associated protein